ncbi:MAG: uracil-DNA glycosylase family protein [Pseudomonadales bacterium]|nr:uracil-DNA glycosylase family protein [Pseudomonadales bacterium]MCP5329742.1 uracil-DNA glycosylase family protein [Pseudomonadales bacterium]MCP5343719.1 uracil-DNA glycosylase family protein [Pseudomonadales bacterium]
MSHTLNELLVQVRSCHLCAEHLPLGPRPVVRAQPGARLMIIGQAPGTKVHASGIPWDDASGKRLREWLQMDRETFYDENRVAIMPMGFCYPGKGRSGDLPPRPECAPQWHAPLLAQLPQVSLVLLIGQYAQQYYLPQRPASLTETVQQWQRFGPRYFPLPHPSPRNQLWLKRNPWFEAEVLPALRSAVTTSMEKGSG